LCLDSVSRQKLRWKIRIYADEKPTFLNRGFALKGFEGFGICNSLCQIK